MPLLLTLDLVWLNAITIVPWTLIGTLPLYIIVTNLLSQTLSTGVASGNSEMLVVPHN